MHLPQLQSPQQPGQVTAFAEQARTEMVFTILINSGQEVGLYTLVVSPPAASINCSGQMVVKSPTPIERIVTPGRLFLIQWYHLVISATQVAFLAQFFSVVHPQLIALSVDPSHK
jgi:hypothetical protein